MLLVNFIVLKGSGQEHNFSEEMHLEAEVYCKGDGVKENKIIQEVTTRQATPPKMSFFVINFGKSCHFSRDQSSHVMTCCQLDCPSQQLIL